MSLLSGIGRWSLLSDWIEKLSLLSDLIERFYMLPGIGKLSLLTGIERYESDFSLDSKSESALWLDSKSSLRSS